MQEQTNLAVKERTGAECLVDVLNELGVEYLFSHTGGAVIPIHVEITKRYKEGRQTPKRIMFRQEPGAGHAAEGYARASGKVGVVLATSGPGATNLVTPVNDAYMDSTPCVFITGQVASKLIGTGAFQEAPITDITSPITKQTYLIKNTDDIGWVLRQAFNIASTGRKGPVLVDICKDAVINTTQNGHESRELIGYNPNVELDNGIADRIINAMLNSERPVIKGGGGIVASEGSELLYEFVKKYKIPTTLTFMGTGAIPHDNPMFLGMPGMHGTYTANKALAEADFILTLGGKHDDRVISKSFGNRAKIAHVDIDESEIGTKVNTDYGLHADVKDFLEFALSNDYKTNKGLSEWHAQIRKWKKGFSLKYKQSRNPVKAQYVIQQLSELTQGSATITTGVGQHQMWALHYYNFQQPRQWISSGGLGTMGFGLPAAIGAYYANPSKPVICIDGDGSFQMNMQELGTIMEYNIPIKVIIMNNGYLGMVRQWEDIMDDKHHEETLLDNPDFSQLGALYHNKIVSKSVKKTADVRAALEEMLKSDKPYILDMWVDKEENVYPFIPSGKGVDEIMLK